MRYQNPDNENRGTHCAMRWLSLWGPPILYMALIFCLSGIPDLPHPRGPFWSMDKLHHMAAYFGLTLLVFRASALWPIVTSPGAFVQSFVLASLYGITDECHQRFIPGRRCEMLDWIADVIGVLAALLIFFVVMVYRQVQSNGGIGIGRRGQGLRSGRQEEGTTQ